MKKRNYVVAVGMIALLIQNGACAMEGEGRMRRAGRWVGEKAAQAKEATLDKLVKEARDFAKDVRKFRKCRKAGTCSPELISRVRRDAAGLVTLVTSALAVLAMAKFARVPSVVELREESIFAGPESTPETVARATTREAREAREARGRQRLRVVDERLRQTEARVRQKGQQRELQEAEKKAAKEREERIMRWRQ